MSGTPGGSGFVSVAAGQAHSVAVGSDGRLVSWGSDHYGQVSGTPAGPGFVLVAAAPSGVKFGADCFVCSSVFLAFNFNNL